MSSLAAQAIVSDLLAVISRQRPLAAAGALLDDKVELYMDNHCIASGAAAWFRWVHFLQRQADKKQLQELGIEVQRMEEENDTVEVTAHWQARINGCWQKSAPGRVSYRVREGKIVRIKTHRRNYIFIHGAAMAKSWLAFYLLLLRLMLSPRPVINQ